ncbi:MAG: helical backbone metal receptor [Acidobacteriota bacterium]|nr:helical backbone metal receptor [Acidobacteriota bacterium]
MSLAPNLTEILFALGLSRQVAGVTSFCDYPEEARQKEIIGGLIDPSLEKIRVLEPDLILGFRGNPRRILDRLYEEKLPLQAFETGQTFEDLFSLIDRISRLTCSQARGQELNSSLREKIQAIEARLPETKTPLRAFLTLYGQGQALWTCGHNSYLDYLLNRAGLQNIASELEGNWSAYNPEKLIAENPELILILARNKEAFKQAVKWLGSLTPLREIKAVKNGSFVFLDENLFSRFGPRLIDAYNWLVRAVYSPSEQGGK